MVVAGLLCKYRLDREALSSYFAFGREIKWGRRDGTGNPLATVYRCKDGKAFWLTGFEADRHWPATVRAVGQSEWLNDARFATARSRRENQRQLVAELDAVFATKTREEWAALFQSEGVWWAPVLTAAEAIRQNLIRIPFEFGIFFRRLPQLSQLALHLGGCRPASACSRILRRILALIEGEGGGKDTGRLEALPHRRSAAHLRRTP